MRRFTVFSVFILFVGTAVYVGTLRASKPMPIQPKRGFSIEYKVTRSHEGQVYATGHLTRLVSENGNFKAISTQVGPDGSVRTHTTIGTAEGVFGLSGGKLELLSGPNDNSIEEPYRSEDFLKSHVSFNRKEQVLGYDCYVFRDENKGGYQEEFYHPAFGGTYLKLVRVAGEGREIKEAIAVEFGEPNPALLNKPNQAVSFGIIDSKIAAERENGNLEQANRLEAARNKQSKK